ncbi:MAG TPA: serine/threonine-protein kinase [Trebonia sp.]
MESGTELAGRYRLDKLLGRGGTGEVWQCRDQRLKRDVAVKVLLAATPGPDGERRSRQEAESAAGLHHPGITVVFDIDQHEGQLFIVTELLHGQDLARHLAQHPGGLPAGQVIGIGTEIAAALAYAHGQGIVHGGLKPLNIFVPDAGPLKVCDFGIARDREGQSPGPSVDLHALGGILYELLTGQEPFSGPGQPAFGHQQLTVPLVPPVPPQDRRPEVPAALGELVMALLEQAPGRRPPDAAAVLATLTQIRDLAGTAYPGHPAGRGEPPGQQRDPFDPAALIPRAESPRVSPVRPGPMVACTSPRPGLLDVYAADPAGQTRRRIGTADGDFWSWHFQGDLPPATGKIAALAATSNREQMKISAVMDGSVCVSEGLRDWLRLEAALPGLTVTDLAAASAPAGTPNASSGQTYWLGSDGQVWRADARTPLPVPAPGPFHAIASSMWGKTDLDQVLLVATDTDVHCRYWWAGAREYRWRGVPANMAGRPVTDLAGAALAARRVEVFALAGDGSVWQSTFRIILDGILDWSNWVYVPTPPGQVTAIAACQLDWSHGALVAATSDGAVHFGEYEIDVTRTSLSRWSQWAPVLSPPQDSR